MLAHNLCSDSLSDKGQSFVQISHGFPHNTHQFVSFWACFEHWMAVVPEQHER